MRDRRRSANSFRGSLRWHMPHCLEAAMRRECYAATTLFLRRITGTMARARAPIAARATVYGASGRVAVGIAAASGNDSTDGCVASVLIVIGPGTRLPMYAESVVDRT